MGAIIAQSGSSRTTMSPTPWAKSRTLHKITNVTCACLSILEPMVDTRWFVESNVGILYRVRIVQDWKLFLKRTFSASTLWQDHLAHIMGRGNMSRNFLHNTVRWAVMKNDDKTKDGNAIAQAISKEELCQQRHSNQYLHQMVRACRAQ